MADTFAPDERSAIMRAVRSRHTAPEHQVRRIVRRLGIRFRGHCRELPGAPDLSCAARRAAIFIHGCFWHGHSCARGARMPKTNRTYWEAKIARNKARDRRALAALRRLGWRPIVVWECALKNEAAVEKRLDRFLAAP
jgi:DNA mismatch endonuclease (patch repair protein)